MCVCVFDVIKHWSGSKNIFDNNGKLIGKWFKKSYEPKYKELTKVHVAII